MTKILKFNEYLSEGLYSRWLITLGATPFVWFKMEPTKLDSNKAGLKLFFSCGCDIDDLTSCKLNFECFYSITIEDNKYKINTEKETVYDANNKNNELTWNMFKCAQFPFAHKDNLIDIIYDEFSKDNSNKVANNLYINLLTGELKQNGLNVFIDASSANRLRIECFEKFSEFIEKTIKEGLNE